MAPIFLNTHVLVVILFLLLFLAKALLLFFNRHAQLDKVRSSTKMLDTVFGVLLLVTGGYLLLNYNGGVPTWLWLKVLLVLGVIPVAIVGIKRHSKVLTAMGLLIFFYVYGLAETKSLKMRPDKGEGETVTSAPFGEAEPVRKDSTQAQHTILSQLEGVQLQNTKAIYTQLCATCHGEDGQKGASGATLLQESTLSVQESKAVIAQGRGLMPGFSATLTEQEMEMLALYSTLLKK
ncbi:MAG: c-type cytochrome [Rufibacter sp.]